MCNGRAAYSSASSYRLASRSTSEATAAFSALFHIFYGLATGRQKYELEDLSDQRANRALAYPPPLLPSVPLQFSRLSSTSQSNPAVKETLSTIEAPERAKHVASNTKEKRFNDVIRETMAVQPRTTLHSRHDTRKRSNAKGLHWWKSSYIIFESVGVILTSITSPGTTLITTMVGAWCTHSRTLFP